LIDQAMALPSGFSMTLSNLIGIRLVLFGLVVMPPTELDLPFGCCPNHIFRSA
jgi:hypothetical protein